MIPAVFKKIEPEYWSPSIKKRPVSLFRYDALDNRFYYEFVRGKGIPHISVTSLANLVLPKSKFFDKWLMDRGPDAMTEKNQKAIFGTIFHIQAMSPFRGDTIHGKGYNYDWLLETDSLGVTNFEKMFPVEFRHEVMKWHRPFVKGLHAWFRFVHERVTEVIAIEMPLRSRTKGVAATLDFVHKAMYNGKERNCITDIKSFLYSEIEGDESDKTYYDAHEFQLEIQKMIWNENFGKEFPVDHIFNWSPKNWRDEPTWTWKCQNKNKFSLPVRFGNKRMNQLDFYLQIAKAQKLIAPPTKVASIVGKFDDLQHFNWEDHIFEFNFFDKTKNKD